MLARAERMLATFSVRRSSRAAASTGAADRRAGDPRRRPGLVALPGVDPERSDRDHNGAVDPGERVLRRSCARPPSPDLSAQGRFERPCRAAGPLRDAAQRRRHGCLVIRLAKGLAEERADPPTDINSGVSRVPPASEPVGQSDAFIVVRCATPCCSRIVFPTRSAGTRPSPTQGQAVRERPNHRAAAQARRRPKATTSTVGTVTNIVRYITRRTAVHVICQGVQRFRITEFVEGQPFLMARGVHLAEPTPTERNRGRFIRAEAAGQRV